MWSGEAVVHVSIVNWVKGTEVGPKQLFIQKGDNRDSPWEQYSLEWINSALSPGLDVTAAIPLRASISSEACFQGQTHGHEGFLLDFVEAKQVSKDERAARVLHPYLTGDDFLEGGEPTRYVIDLNEAKDVLAARGFGSAFQHVEETVMPAMQAAAEKEQRVSKRTTGPRQSHAKKWWKHWRGRGELLRAISQIPRYIACARVTKRPIFVFVDSAIRPNDALTAFPLADDYSFGILQSGIHFEWFKARCSALKGDFRYTSDTVFDTFPWPQKPGRAQIKAVAEAGVALRTLRRETMRKLNYSLRDLYRTLEQPGDNPLRDTHAWLDVAVRATYGMPANTDPLTFLLQLNLTCAKKEKAREQITPPGLPLRSEDRPSFITSDCIQPHVLS